MKNVMVSCWLVLSVALPISSASRAAQMFVASAGQVSIDDRIFGSMAEYVSSEYFRENGLRCGTRRSSHAVDEQLLKATGDCTLSLTNIDSEYWPSVVYSIPVWFHVIYDTNGTGNITDSAIYAQMQVLNEDFRAVSNSMGSLGYDVKIQFELKGITRIQNDAWFSDADEQGYKTALKKDPVKFLNVYSNTAGGYLGYAYYPQDYAGDWRDGIVLNYQAIGGRDNGFDVFDQGRTLVHEVGHYLGLAHTFDGYSCDNSYSTGDLIVDTNAENDQHFGCSPTSTCGTLDPIHNYMNYTDDVCMHEFTREQANRAVCSLVNYRPGLFRIIGGGGGDDGGDDGGDETPLGPTVPPFLTPLLLDS